VVDCNVQRCIALTFDDGPSAHTGAVLDILRDRGVHATFFVQGYMVVNNPGMVLRAAQEGHVIGNHSWNHPSFVKIGAGAAVDQINATQEAIAAAGVGPSGLVRPPYGAINQEIVNAAYAVAFVMWDVDTRDWESHNPEQVLAEVMTHARPGSIVLMHDTVAENAAMLGALIDQLRGLGYALVTVPEMFGGGVAPGAVVYNGPRAP
jgi:peptidoglycan/xylan/chitin deacetylase (PgdA/CDA1 family)